jgi:hypothetical protein
MMPRRLFPPAVMVVLLWLGGAPLNHALAGASPGKEPSAPGPEERILVGPLGYQPPGPLYMLSGRVFSSLDFVDADHLLFTFHQPRLLRREGNPGESDDGQMIHAVVLDLSDGAVSASAEWRMRDRSRYLWPVGKGKFLVRQRNTYSLTDASLKLRKYIEVSTPVLETEVSPDGSILVVEHQYEKHTAEEHTKLVAQAAEYGGPPPAEDIQITLLDVASRDTLAALRTPSPTAVPITSNGYVGVARDKDRDDDFVVRFVPFQGEVLALGKVSSTCTPHENFLSQKALIIESCGPKSPDIFLDAWSTDGRKLWSGHREGHLVWPTFAVSRAGNRFAVSLLRVSHFIDLTDSLIDEDVKGQVVQVFDTETGALLMTTTASPVLSAGLNFALSDDGDRLAILRDGAIEIDKVPSPPAPSPQVKAASEPPAPRKK